MGDSPTLMFNAPVPAAKKVRKSRAELADIDLFEINEAFSVVTEKFIRDLDIDREKSTSMAAPWLWVTRLVPQVPFWLTMLDELERQDKQFGLVTTKLQGGMAPAIILERV